MAKYSTNRRNLAVFRAKHGMNQSEMADKIGVSRSTYSQIENGKRNCSQTFLNKLQAAFEIPDESVWELTKIYIEKD